MFSRPYGGTTAATTAPPLTLTNCHHRGKPGSLRSDNLQCQIRRRYAPDHLVAPILHSVKVQALLWARLNVT
jgi:hypothetical protein